MAEIVPLLNGKSLYLRALTESDADGAYPSWFNDREICAGNSHGVFPYSRDNALAYIRHAHQTRDELILAVVTRDGDRHIGNVALQHIHPIYRCAEFSIVLGERDCHGKGYGLEAARLICAHGFDALNLHRIGCGTFAGNVAMIGLAEALGMTREGVRRQAAFKAGRYLDVVEFGMLKDEFMMREPK